MASQCKAIRISSTSSPITRKPRPPASSEAWHKCARSARARAIGPALATTQQALSQISGEAKFGDARAELASILPSLAEGLARAADRAKDQKLVEQAHRAIELVNKYVPKELRPGQRMQDVEHSLELTSREIARSSAIVESGCRYAGGCRTGRHGRRLCGAKDAAQELPRPGGQSEPARCGAGGCGRRTECRKCQPEGACRGDLERESPVQVSVGLASRSGKNAPGIEGQTICVLASGAVSAVDASSGNLLWRRPAGSQATTQPIAVSGQPGADALLVDARQQELCRVNTRTGKLRWRQPLGSEVAGRPVVAGSQVWVATQPGRLLAIDLESGSLVLSIQLPQKVPTGPGAGCHRGAALYQVGEHSSLFVLSTKTGQCEQVFYLGHEAGTIVAPALCVSRYAFVAENHLLDNARLWVILSDESEGTLQEVATVLLDGHVQVAPQMVESSALRCDRSGCRLRL